LPVAHGGLEPGNSSGDVQRQVKAGQVFSKGNAFETMEAISRSSEADKTIKVVWPSGPVPNLRFECTV